METSRTQRAYRFRFYPTPGQENLLRRTLGCVRLVYNKALALRSETWTREQRNVSYRDTGKALTGWKKSEGLAFLNDVSCVPLQQALRHLQTAYSNFFNHTGDFPAFKRKAHGGSATFTRYAFTWDGCKRHLKLAKMKEPLRVIWSRTLPVKAVPSSVTISLDAAGRWHVGILVEEHVKPIPRTDTRIGVDMGVDSFAALSDGEKIPNPRFRKRNAKRLGKAQRNLARKQKGSRNYEKARLKVARIQAQGADRRKDFLHKLSTRIIRENQTVVLEDLAVRNMCRKAAPKEDRAHPGRYLPNGRAAKRGLNRSITDAGWRMFRTMLEYKAAWYGRQLIVIDRWYPSSQICSHCGKNNGKKPLNVRAWTCPYCHTTHDRDVNAAKNILAAGLAVNVCGDGRKHHNN
ncbi:transposase, IS605 OrfB family [Bifidobacterium gallicum DSM 20093 = LMG 11596]|uniref:Transposase, IS605 OrfB family n=2 Tax=Bifidobacterium gallicum DSM 20093 = LMG 11596 TaxID=561180 RepID=D1NWW1_9BIFI|nr:RNA-guided endonuclease TnpB family protein [Bifidobacterium gallicum]EFA22170.1 transposase, IS605 OrfB family [Bifidobacterium gallicum DSM 20093 = LMG 11596]